MCGIFSLSRCHFLTPVYFAVSREESSSLCPNTFLTSYQLTQSIGQDREKYNFAISWRLTCPSNQTPNPESTSSESVSLNPKFWSEQTYFAISWRFLFWANMFFLDSKSSQIYLFWWVIFSWNFEVGCFFAQKKPNAQSGIVKNLEW